MGEKIQIGQIIIEKGGVPLVIPEIGINHNGSLKTAMEMVYAAKRAGARLIKHQTHIVEDEMSSMAKHVIPGNSEKSIFDIMRQCALSEEEEKELMQYTNSLGMEFLSTPFSRAAAERLEKMGVKAYKIGSGEMNHYPLLDYVASFGKPMIVSTGMNSIENVRKAVQVLEKRKVPFALLHTTNLYPTPPELVRLGAMRELMEEYPDKVIGLSDHTIGNHACIAALAWGAGIIEKHFTDRMDRKGPDIVCSMDEAALKNLLIAASEVPKMLYGEKIATKEEQITMDFAFSTLVTIQKVKKGEVFTKKNLWAKRPGIGKIPAWKLNEVIGKKATMNIEIDTHLDWSMIGD